MIEVTVDSVRVSLMAQHRVVVLKEPDSNRYLPIWIGPFEAEAITIVLQGVEVARPLTHDLLNGIINTLGAKVLHVHISDLQNDTFYAHVFLNVDGQVIEVDSRPSDAIALAVRAKAPIFVHEDVMERAGIVPEEEIALGEGISQKGIETREKDKDDEVEVPEEDLEVFKDFIEGMDLEDLSKDE